MKKAETAQHVLNLSPFMRTSARNVQKNKSRLSKIAKTVKSLKSAWWKKSRKYAPTKNIRRVQPVASQRASVRNVQRLKRKLSRNAKQMMASTKSVLLKQSKKYAPQIKTG